MKTGSHGTKWNHIKKECDYPDEVDCERKPPTLEPPSTTETVKETEIPIKETISTEKTSTLTSSSKISNSSGNIYFI